MMIEISTEKLAEQQRELDRLTAREQELLECNSRLVAERRAVDRRAMVRHFFREVAIQPLPVNPAIPSDERVRFRARLIAEEFVEVMHALLGQYRPRGWMLDDIKRRLDEYIDVASIGDDLPGLAKELADLAYVVEGAWLDFGIDSRPVFAAVHEDNLKKKDGPRRPDGKLIKAPDHQGPDIERVLREQRINA